MKSLFNRRNIATTGNTSLPESELRKIDDLFRSKTDEQTTAGISLTFLFTTESARSAQKFALKLSEKNWTSRYFKKQHKNCKIQANTPTLPFDEKTVKNYISEFYDLAEKCNITCEGWDWVK